MAAHVRPEPGPDHRLLGVVNDWTNAAGEPVRFGGGKLAPNLSWPKLNARWEPVTTDHRNQREQQLPAGAGRHPEPGAPGAPGAPGPAAVPHTPLTDAEAEYVWREAERIVREAAEQITAEAGANPDAAADAAWAASDTLNAAAAGLEGDPGGPITAAAAAFDRAGRDVNRRVPARTDTGAALSRSHDRPARARHEPSGRPGRGRHHRAGRAHRRGGRSTVIPAATTPGRGRAGLSPAATARHTRTDHSHRAGAAAADAQRRRHCQPVLRAQVRHGPALKQPTPATGTKPTTDPRTQRPRDPAEARVAVADRNSSYYKSKVIANLPDEVRREV